MDNVTVSTTTGRRRNGLLAAGLTAAFVVLLTACPPPPTPTTTTTTTTSTTTTTIAPGCVGYTPTGISLSDNLASPGDSITVTGFGNPNPTVGIQIRMVPLGPGTPTGVLATTPNVPPAGVWATPLTIPTLTVGFWKVQANAIGCTGTGSATIQIV